MLIFEPTYSYNEDTHVYSVSSKVENTGDVFGANYVGGLVGFVGASDSVTEGATLQFENKPITINGTFGSSIANTVAVFSGTDDQQANSGSRVVGSGDNVGGLVGAISGNFNSTLIKYAFATGRTTTGVKGVNNVGGLVGLMEGAEASVENCFFAKLTSNSQYTTSRITGTAYVGGLVGRMNGGKLINSIGMAVILSDCGDTKSGVVGAKFGSATITDSWAIYHKAGADYTDTINTDQGKGVIITTSSSATVKVPTAAEVAQMVGLIVDAKETAVTIGESKTLTVSTFNARYGNNGTIYNSGANIAAAQAGYMFDDSNNVVTSTTLGGYTYSLVVCTNPGYAGQKYNYNNGAFEPSGSGVYLRAANSMAGAAGYISVAIGLPSTNNQLVFYKANGNDATYAISNFDAKLSSSEVVYLKLDMTKDSFSICVKSIKFKSLRKFIESLIVCP